MSDENVPAFIAQLEQHDSDIGREVVSAFQTVRSDGALSAQTKTLLVLALDAALGHDDSVTALADLAREQGASEEELLEVVEVVTVTCGIQALNTASAVFE